MLRFRNVSSVMILLLSFWAMSAGAETKATKAAPDERHIYIELPEKYWNLEVTDSYVSSLLGLKFSLPKGSKAYLSAPEKLDKKRILQIFIQKPDAIKEMENECESDAMEASQKQEELFAKAATDADALKIMKQRVWNTERAHLALGSVKAAYGFSWCVKDTAKDENVKELNQEAVFFWKGQRVRLLLDNSLDAPVDELLLVKQIKTFEKEKSLQDAWKRWDIFGKIVKGVKK